MIPSLTSWQVVNRALTEIVQQPGVSSGTPATNFDGTPQGIYAATLYPGAVNLLLRQQDPEFARRVIALSLSGGTAPYPWAYEYVYPTDCVRVRQVRPASWDVTDPQPIRWDVGNNGSETVVWSSVASAALTYTSNAVTEGEWDDGFTEIVVRYLGSQLALPVSGRPDFSREMMEISGRMSGSLSQKDS